MNCSVNIVVPIDAFEERFRDVSQIECCPAAEVRPVLRPYHEIAVLLVQTGVERKLLSVGEVAEIERCAFRKLRRNPKVRDLYHELFEKTPALA